MLPTSLSRLFSWKRPAPVVAVPTPAPAMGRTAVAPAIAHRQDLSPRRELAVAVTRPNHAPLPRRTVTVWIGTSSFQAVLI